MPGVCGVEVSAGFGVKGRIASRRLLSHDHTHMAASAFIHLRVTVETKLRLRALADRVCHRLYTTSALIPASRSADSLPCIGSLHPGRAVVQDARVAWRGAIHAVLSGSERKMRVSFSAGAGGSCMASVDEKNHICRLNACLVTVDRLARRSLCLRLYSNSLRSGSTATSCRRARAQVGTLYPILMRLSDQGFLLLTLERVGAGGRPPRHVYRLSASGSHSRVKNKKTHQHSKSPVG
jgi:hypothetical protein